MKPDSLWLAAANRLLELASRVNLALYLKGWRTRHRADVPVISVGNIALGGTGKTPLVAALVHLLTEAGARPAVLTRGYGRTTRRPILARGGEDRPWREIGDEPALLCRTLPGVPIVVDADRVRGAAAAIRSESVTHLILDDGFQHWRLIRDLDLVAVNAENPLASGRLRREPPTALSRADAVILTRTADQHQLRTAAAAIRRFAPNVPVVATRLQVRAVRRAGVSLPASSLLGVPVVALAAIGTPAGFVQTLQEIGAHVVERYFFPDHHPFSSGEVTRILAAAVREGARVVTTEKDAVRLPDGLHSEVDWLEVETAPLDSGLADLIRPLLQRPGPNPFTIGT